MSQTTTSHKITASKRRFSTLEYRPTLLFAATLAPPQPQVVTSSNKSGPATCTSKTTRLFTSSDSKRLGHKKERSPRPQATPDVNSPPPKQQPQTKKLL
jgi:hypothetical protein